MFSSRYVGPRNITIGCSKHCIGILRLDWAPNLPLFYCEGPPQMKFFGWNPMLTVHLFSVLSFVHSTNTTNSNMVQLCGILVYSFNIHLPTHARFVFRIWTASSNQKLNSYAMRWMLENMPRHLGVKEDLLEWIGTQPFVQGLFLLYLLHHDEWKGVS